MWVLTYIILYHYEKSVRMQPILQQALDRRSWPDNVNVLYSNILYIRTTINRIMIYVNRRLLSVAEAISRPSRTGWQRYDYPAGRRPRGHESRPGVRVHGLGRRPRTQHGRFRDGCGRAGHRTVTGPATTLGNVHSPATSSLPPALTARIHVWPDATDDGPAATAAAAAAPLLQGPSATQDHGNPDTVALGPELPTAVCHSKVLGSEDRTKWPSGVTGAPTDHYHCSG